MAIHSLGWLVAANAIGLWMGVCLLWPNVGDEIAPFTFGRWAPLHLNWQLYGWCSLPLVGALFAWFLNSENVHAARDARWSLRAWTVALIFGGVAWLGGTVSGKLFLEWHGWARPLLPLAMLVLWGVLTVHTRGRWERLATSERGLRALMLALLLPVPFVLFWSTSPGLYPSVNPDSGGATGAALLGSTLGIVTLFMLLPRWVGLKQEGNGRPFWWALGASWFVFAAIDRGNASHYSVAQVLALGTLLVWVPLLPLFWSRQNWPVATRPWLRAAAAWWSLLVVSGWLTFLPAISEALKFTHALVGHAHLAMAGLVTSVNGAILVAITHRSPSRGVFVVWQLGCAVFVAAMLTLGWSEAEHQAELFRSETWTQFLLGVRLIGGALMTAASGQWLLTVIRS